MIRPSLALSALALVAGLSAVPLQAAPIPVQALFNTGVDGSGTSLADNAADAHYLIVGAPATESGFLLTNPVAATSAGGFPVGPWRADSSISAFITPRANTTGDAGNWTYRTTFTIPAGSDPGTAWLQGISSTDNDLVDIILNGVSMRKGGAVVHPTNFDTTSLPWQVTDGFVSGINVLDFVVNEATGAANANGFTSLRVEMSGLVASAGYVPIPGLLNTGELTSGGLVGAEDSSATLWTGTDTLNAPFTPVVATATGGFPIGPWLGDDGASTWITPAGDTNGAEGAFRYSLEVDLTGLDPATTEIYGRTAVDNAVTDILVNGVSSGQTNGAGFGGWTDFTLASGFQPGMNTLTFVVENGPGAGPTGLRVEFASGFAMPVPEPAAAGLLVVGAAGLLRRRRK